MKKVINNKVYDTSTARLIADAPHKNIKGSDGTCEQRLYLKKNGEFFLWLAGARSEIVSNMALDNGIHDRERHFYPISYEQARSWAEEEMTADEWLAIFEPVEDESLTAFNLTLSASAVSKFRLAAQRQQISQRELMERLIETL